MYTIRATVFLGKGELTTVFLKTPDEEIDKTREYKVFALYISKDMNVLGADLVNPEIIFKD
jgi:hypothetical protein